MRASSTNMRWNRSSEAYLGRIVLTATRRWNPCLPVCRAIHTLAMPPSAIGRSSSYRSSRRPGAIGDGRGGMRLMASVPLRVRRDGAVASRRRVHVHVSDEVPLVHPAVAVGGARTADDGRSEEHT